MASVNDLILPNGSPTPQTPRPLMVVDNVHVNYRVYASGKQTSVRESVFSLRAMRGGRGLQTVPALRGVSFSATEGETIGVVGHNGSGKSTLFRAMAGLIPASEGEILAADRPVLLGVNAALMPELSGENNIKLGLLAMGFTPEEAAEQVTPISEFAELNEFIYHPMRTYSSGMGARLRFAIASAKAHSILLIDEALSVGDRRFKLKSEKRIRELRDSAGLVMIVSHSASSLRDTCERVLWIHKGELRADGKSKEVIDEYVRWTKNPSNIAVGAASPTSPKPRSARLKRAVAAKVAAASQALAESESLITAEKTSNAEPSLAAAANEGRTVGEGDVANASPADVDALPPATTPSGVAMSDIHASTEMAPPAETATTASTSPIRPLPTAPVAIASNSENPRATARWERYRSTKERRARRRIVAIAVIGASLVVAVVAGAAISLAASQADRAELTELLASATATPTPPPAGLLPIINEFTADATVYCEDDETSARVQLRWDVSHATRVAVVSGPVETGASLLVDQPLSASDQAVPFNCAAESQSYALVTYNERGQQVSSTVIVLRELGTDQTDATPSAQGAPPEGGSASTEPEPVPAPLPVQPPLPNPPPTPVAEPSPEPSGTPKITPTPTPEPTNTIILESPEPSAT